MDLRRNYNFEEFSSGSTLTDSTMDGLVEWGDSDEEDIFTRFPLPPRPSERFELDPAAVVPKPPQSTMRLKMGSFSDFKRTDLIVSVLLESMESNRRWVPLCHYLSECYKRESPYEQDRVNELIPTDKMQEELESADSDFFKIKSNDEYSFIRTLRQRLAPYVPIHAMNESSELMPEVDEIPIPCSSSATNTICRKIDSVLHADADRSSGSTEDSYKTALMELSECDDLLFNEAENDEYGQPSYYLQTSKSSPRMLISQIIRKLQRDGDADGMLQRLKPSVIELNEWLSLLISEIEESEALYNVETEDVESFDVNQTVNDHNITKDVINSPGLNKEDSKSGTTAAVQENFSTIGPDDILKSLSLAQTTSHGRADLVQLPVEPLIKDQETNDGMLSSTNENNAIVSEHGPSIDQASFQLSSTTKLNAATILIGKPIEIDHIDTENALFTEEMSHSVVNKKQNGGLVNGEINPSSIREKVEWHSEGEDTDEDYANSSAHVLNIPIDKQFENVLHIDAENVGVNEKSNECHSEDKVSDQTLDKDNASTRLHATRDTVNRSLTTNLPTRELASDETNPRLLREKVSTNLHRETVTSFDEGNERLTADEASGQTLEKDDANTGSHAIYEADNLAVTAKKETEVSVNDETDLRPLGENVSTCLRRETSTGIDEGNGRLCVEEWTGQTLEKDDVQICEDVKSATSMEQAANAQSNDGHLSIQTSDLEISAPSGEKTSSHQTQRDSPNESDSITYCDEELQMEETTNKERSEKIKPSLSDNNILDGSNKANFQDSNLALSSETKEDEGVQQVSAEYRSKNNNEEVDARRHSRPFSKELDNNDLRFSSHQEDAEDDGFKQGNDIPYGGKLAEISRDSNSKLYLQAIEYTQSLETESKLSPNVSIVESEDINSIREEPLGNKDNTECIPHRESIFADNQATDDKNSLVSIVIPSNLDVVPKLMVSQGTQTTLSVHRDEGKNSVQSDVIRKNKACIGGEIQSLWKSEDMEQSFEPAAVMNATLIDLTKIPLIISEECNCSFQNGGTDDIQLYINANQTGKITKTVETEIESVKSVDPRLTQGYLRHDLLVTEQQKVEKEFNRSTEELMDVSGSIERRHQFMNAGKLEEISNNDNQKLDPMSEDCNCSHADASEEGVDDVNSELITRYVSQVQLTNRSQLSNESRHLLGMQEKLSVTHTELSETKIAQRQSDDVSKGNVIPEIQQIIHTPQHSTQSKVATEDVTESVKHYLHHDTSSLDYTKEEPSSVEREKLSVAGKRIAISSTDVTQKKRGNPHLERVGIAHEYRFSANNLSTCANEEGTEGEPIEMKSNAGDDDMDQIVHRDKQLKKSLEASTPCAVSNVTFTVGMDETADLEQRVAKLERDVLEFKISMKLPIREPKARNLVRATPQPQIMAIRGQSKNPPIVRKVGKKSKESKTTSDETSIEYVLNELHTKFNITLSNDEIHGAPICPKCSVEKIEKLLCERKGELAKYRKNLEEKIGNNGDTQCEERIGDANEERKEQVSSEVLCDSGVTPQSIPSQTIVSKTVVPFGREESVSSCGVFGSVLMNGLIENQAPLSRMHSSRGSLSDFSEDENNSTEEEETENISLNLKDVEKADKELTNLLDEFEHSSRTVDEVKKEALQLRDIIVDGVIAKKVKLRVSKAQKMYEKLKKLKKTSIALAGSSYTRKQAPITGQIDESLSSPLQLTRFFNRMLLLSWTLSPKLAENEIRAFLIYVNDEIHLKVRNTSRRQAVLTNVESPSVITICAEMAEEEKIIAIGRTTESTSLQETATDLNASISDVCKTSIMQP